MSSLVTGDPESLRRIARHFQEIGQKYLDDSMAYRAKADRLEAPAALVGLTDRMIIGLRFARWNADDKKIVGNYRPFPVTMRALIHRGLMTQGEVPTTLGAAVLALLDDQKKDA